MDKLRPSAGATEPPWSVPPDFHLFSAGFVTEVDPDHVDSKCEEKALLQRYDLIQLACMEL
jgi:hypothetical protein